jgi:hypothetical protein
MFFNKVFNTSNAVQYGQEISAITKSIFNIGNGVNMH